MAANDYFSVPRSQPNLNAPLPPLPAPSPDGYSQNPSAVALSPLSPFDDEAYPAQYGQYGQYPDEGYADKTRTVGHERDPFSDDDAIPLWQQYPKSDLPPLPPESRNDLSQEQDHNPRSTRHDRRKKSVHQKAPWVVYVLTFAQITVFIAEIINNAVLTGSPIEIHPQFNPMIGPSFYVLINMGARYVPCMRSQPGIQNSNIEILWPCPNQTTVNPTCSLSELCGFSGVPNPHVGGSINATPAPNQWYRFIIPIFLHAGLVHIGFNMILQWLLGRDMERLIGSIRFTLVYFSAGIFGFIMGGNFAPAGIASTGASGALYGIIALTLLDLLYTWPTRTSPWRDLLFIMLDVAISFVLGLLPGIDNFSHIGGFLMGLALGLCLLRSPIWLRKRTGAESSAASSIDDNSGHSGTAEVKHCDRSGHVDHRHQRNGARQKRTQHDRRSSLTAFFASPRTFFLNRTPLWWAWWLVRTAALVAALVCFVLLLQNFYVYRDTCSWCRYLSCINYSNWCDIGNLNFQKTPNPNRVKLF